MKVKNETHYDTHKLRSIICAAHGEIAKTEGRLSKIQWEDLVVEVGYSRNGCYSGRAFYKGRWMRLHLPKKCADAYRVAWLVKHELYHTYGYRHRAMGKEGWGWPYLVEEYAWGARAMNGICLPVVEPKKPKKSTTRELQEQRYARLLARERVWQAKLRRAENALKKIKKGKKYYGRVLNG